MGDCRHGPEQSAGVARHIDMMRTLVAVLLLVAACAPAAQPTAPPQTSASPPPGSTVAAPTPTPLPVAQIDGIAEQRSSAARLPLDSATREQLDALVAADTDFALRLYRQIVAAEQGNIFLSPYSISTALSMAFAGARGRTAEELAAILGVGPDPGVWHAARNRLELSLADVSGTLPSGSEAVPLTLEPTNAVFGQLGYPFKTDFLDILAADYGAGMQAVNFASDTEAARVAINAWVAGRTRERIEELLQRGDIDPLTVAVLVNAIYFKASWMYGFDAEKTADTPFHLLDGSTRDVPMMHFTIAPKLQYARGVGWQAVRLPYFGASMLVIVPEEGTFADIERDLDAAFLADLEQAMSETEVTLGLPRWESESMFGLVPQLQAMGIVDLFDDQRADLSGIADVEQLYVSDVIHQANVTVDEKGTEAAAATAVTVRALSAGPSVSLIIDRPFLYLIRDNATGEILFLGRLLAP